jgi:hypothetical protein
LMFLLLLSNACRCEKILVFIYMRLICSLE